MPQTLEFHLEWVVIEIGKFLKVKKLFLTINTKNRSAIWSAKLLPVSSLCCSKSLLTSSMYEDERRKDVIKILYHDKALLERNMKTTREILSNFLSHDVKSHVKINVIYFSLAKRFHGFTVMMSRVFHSSRENNVYCIIREMFRK